MLYRNILYAQSGGVTSVINASAYGVITQAQRSPAFGRIFAAQNGILGVLDDRLYDLNAASPEDIARLLYTPGGAFGSCRFDLDVQAAHPEQYVRVFEILAKHDIGYFLYNGGNGSMQTALQLQQEASRIGYPLVSIGIPKTVDNDIMQTDCCPGFGSAAKYLATSMREVAFDMRAMQQRKPRVFIMEVMGRNVGWLAAATALARIQQDDPPHLILLPEVPLDPAHLLARVAETIHHHGFCAITVSEGVRYADGKLLAERDRDAVGHVQLGGAGAVVAELLHQNLGCSYHVSLVDYLQRAARHIAAAVDLAQAEAVGRAAVVYALEGRAGVMPAIKRSSNQPYTWGVEPVELVQTANAERVLPPEYIDAAQLDVTPAFIEYCAPLIAGEAPPPFKEGLPDYRAWNWPLA